MNIHFHNMQKECISLIQFFGVQFNKIYEFKYESTYIYVYVYTKVYKASI